VHRKHRVCRKYKCGKETTRFTGAERHAKLGTQIRIGLRR
jgi:hypothetical protein